MSKNNSPRNSRPGLSEFRDVEFQRFLLRSQPEYQTWWTGKRLFGWVRSLPEDATWNSFICVVALLAIVWVIVDNVGVSQFDVDMFFAELSPYIFSLDVMYNVVYLFHVAAIALNIFLTMAYERINYCTVGGFVLDFISFLHYAIKCDSQKLFKLVCYYLRLHRPFRYLWKLNDYNLKGSILGTTLKYCYIFFVLRVTWALLWIHVETIERKYHGGHTALYTLHVAQLKSDSTNNMYSASQFLVALYIVNKMFIPIGPSVAPNNDIERVACLLVMITGCLVVTGAAVASLSLVISIYMRPEEAFRTRYRLIMKEMKESKIPHKLREKVETFYKMYWHKQKAVSATQLLPTFPPTLPTSIYTDIYFEATQKSRILCDLSCQFLSEVAKKMITIHYIPGDTIIKRSTRKSSIIYIAYGDIEMLSAEDDSTAVVRMTRGTAVAGCAGSLAAASARAHVEIRAATFCTAHALHAPDLWRVALKYGRNTLQTQIILDSFDEHLDRVKRHYFSKIPEDVKYKSSILHFKRNLMALKKAEGDDGKLLLERTDMFLEIAGCYKMRNRADGSQTDEADAICLRSTFPCILQPTSSLLTAWHSLICCVILAVCFLHPYYLVFTKTVPVEFRFFDYIVTALFVVDLIVHLSTGANVEEGVPITFSQTSSQQMRSQWFVLDVVGTLPIFEFIKDGHYAGINKLLRLPKVFRTLKAMEEMCVYNSNQLRFMSYTLLLLIACYLIAALQQSFMCFQFNYCLVSNFTHPPYWKHSKLDEETVNKRLTFGLYWAISMITFTTHMESFGVENWHSILYTMFVLETCIVLHIFIEAVYSATIMVTTALREDYDSCIANVKDFLIRNKVDEQLRQRFITYLQLCWYTDMAYSMTNRKTSIFFDLPPHVYQDIVTRQRSKYLLSIPFMKLLNEEDLKEVSSKAKLFHTSPNEILLNTGDISNEIYLIKKGICEIVDPDTKEVAGSLGIKSHFGVLECLLRLPAYYTVRTVTHVQVFTISMKVLTQVMQLPQVKDAIEFAKEQPEFGRLAVRRESFLQYEASPKPPNMERFRLPRKYEQDNAFLHPFNRLGFFSILRYIFPRFTIRPDGDYLYRYEWCRAACALLSALVFPSYTYLVLQWPGLYWLTLLLDFSAYFDIAQRMMVGYFNEQGVLVYHPTSTAAHYLKGAFFADLLGCLPMEGLESPNKESFQNKYRLTQSRQLLMLNRMLQLYRLPSAMINLEGKIERRDILLVLKAIPLFMALLNTLTCMMIFNSVNIFRSENSDSWLIVPVDDHGGSWVNLFNDSFRFNLTATPWNLYLATQFWVVYETTTTGYNNFNPSNIELMLIVFVGMFIGAMITTYFSVRIISIRANVNKELAAYQEHIKDILVFMRRENLDKKLQKEVMNYYEYNWEKTGGIDYTSVLKLCDQITLRTDAILHIYGPIFEMCPLLSDCDVSLVRMLGRAVRSLYFLRGMQLMEKDDVIRNIFFVDYGYIVVDDSAESTSDLAFGNAVTLTKGSVFGNLENATTVRSPVSIVALSRTHVLQINAAAFQHIIADFPQVAAAMDKYRQQNEHYIMGSSDEAFKESSLNIAAINTSRGDVIKHFYFNDLFVQLYLIIVSLACIYADLFNAGFQRNTKALIAILYALDVMFYMKILMMYSLPLLVPVNMKFLLIPTRRAYFTHEFKYDLLSCLPLELISLGCGRYKWMAFSLLRLNRLLRVVTVYKCLKKRNSRISVNLALSTVFSVLVWFTLFVHTTACLWHFISLIEDNANPHSSWIYNDTGESLCDNLYICSTYFILTTFTQNGVGDIMPKNHAEVIFVSILQIISTMLYMVYVGEFSNIIQFKSFRSFSFYCKYLELQEFLKNNRVSRNLVTVVKRYTLHFWRECRGMQVPHFLTTAPQSLKLRIMSAAYIHHLKENPIFRKCEPAFLRQLVGCLQLYTYNEGMYVVKESEITDAMYLIHTGRVLETSIATGDRKQYTSTECFGMEQGLIYNNPYVYSYKTVTKSQVLTLHLPDWEYLLEHFPKSKTSVYKYLHKGDDFPPRRSTNKGKGKRDISPKFMPPSAHRSSTNLRRSPRTPPPDGPSSPPGGPAPPPPPDAATLQMSGPTSLSGDPSPPLVGPSTLLSGPSLPPSPPDKEPSPMPSQQAEKLSIMVDPSRTSARSAKTDIPLAEKVPVKKTRVISLQPSTSKFSPIDGTSLSTRDVPLEPADEASTNEGALSRTISATAQKSDRSDIAGSKLSPASSPKTVDKEFDKSLPDIDTVVPISTKTTSPKAQMDQTTPMTEPIAAHPYSNTSLKITEIPPSLTKITPTPGLISSKSITRDMMINEDFDLDADNELKQQETQFMWPSESRHSVVTQASELESDRLKSTKSMRSLQSTHSLEESRDNRGPRDIDETLRKSSTTFMDKVETRANKLFGHKKKSEFDYTTSAVSSDKDILLLEEDEEATSALLHQIEKHKGLDPKELQKVKNEDTDKEMTEIVTPDETLSSDTKSDVIELKPQGVKVQEPMPLMSTADADALAVVPYDRKSAANSSKLVDVGDEELINLARKKSVRYKEKSSVISDGSEHDAENKSDDEIDAKKEDDYSEKQHQITRIKEQLSVKKELKILDEKADKASDKKYDEPNLKKEEGPIGNKKKDKVSDANGEESYDKIKSETGVKKDTSSDKIEDDKSIVAKATDKSDEAGSSDKKS